VWLLEEETAGTARGRGSERSEFLYIIRGGRCSLLLHGFGVVAGLHSVCIVYIMY